MGAFCFLPIPRTRVARLGVSWGYSTACEKLCKIIGDLWKVGYWFNVSDKSLIYVDSKVRDQLRRYCEVNKVTMFDITNEAIRERVNQSVSNRIRRQEKRTNPRRRL